MNYSRRFLVKIGNDTFLSHEDELLAWCAERRIDRNTLIAEQNLGEGEKFIAVHNYAKSQSDLRWKKYARPRRSYVLFLIAISLGGMIGLLVSLIDPPSIFDRQWRAHVAAQVANLEKEVSAAKAALQKAETALAIAQKEVAQEKEQAIIAIERLQTQSRALNASHEKRFSELATSHRKNTQILLGTLSTVERIIESSLDSAVRLFVQQYSNHLTSIETQLKDLDTLRADSIRAENTRLQAEKDLSSAFWAKTIDDRTKIAEIARVNETTAIKLEKECREKLYSFLVLDVSGAYPFNVSVKDYLLPLKNAIEQAGSTLEHDSANQSQ